MGTTTLLSTRPSDSYIRLAPFDPETKDLNVIVETPKGSRNKYSFNDKLGLFELNGLLPAGANFPYDFGFVPSTTGEDGDPLDVLLLMDEPAFTGCLVRARLLGVVEAEQTERDGKTTRNDRLIGVAIDSTTHRHLDSLVKLNDNLVTEIEHFFISYNEIKGKQFKPLGRFGPERADTLVKEGRERFLNRGAK